MNHPLVKGKLIPIDGRVTEIIKDGNPIPSPIPSPVPPPKPPTEVKPARRPFLTINNSDPTATAKELARLIAERDDFLFNGHAPVRIAVEADYLPRALVVTPEAIRVLAHEICIPVKARSGLSPAPAPLSKDIAQLYLRGLEGRWRLRPLRGITTAPILDSRGNIRVATGYDVSTGLWCYNIPNLILPEKPSEEDAKEALYRLRFFFRTFPFADSVRVNDPILRVMVTDLKAKVGLDESGFIAGLMTSVCRQSLETAPGLLCTAPAFSGAGTGKGLLIKAVCAHRQWGATPTLYQRPQQGRV